MLAAGQSCHCSKDVFHGMKTQPPGAGLAASGLYSWGRGVGAEPRARGGRILINCF